MALDLDAYRPPDTPRIGDDPDGGQVIDPDGESPEDPLAGGLYRGCIIAFAVIGLFVALFVVLYQTFVAE
jgi:hypothetical protein